jgi:hypothetical protein
VDGSEFVLSGQHGLTPPPAVGASGSVVGLQGMNNGVACGDSAIGTGYMLYSEANTHSRFAGIHPQNADHFVCVVLRGAQWNYDTNSRERPFTPVSTDILVATLDFSTDTATMALGVNQEVGTTAQIHLGYTSGDISVIPNMWGGSANNGEWGVLGAHFITSTGLDEAGVANPVGSGDVACGDGRTGTGYMMYSVQNVHTRFPGVYPSQSDHFVCVTYTGSQWEYDPNSMYGLPFTPVSSDVLVALLDFTADTVRMAAGQDREVGSGWQRIHYGCVCGVQPNPQLHLLIYLKHQILRFTTSSIP